MSRKRIRTWLFRPFDLIAGWHAMVLGVGLIAATATVASYAGLMTDGVLDLHFGPDLPLLTLLAQGLLNWLVLSTCLLIVGLWLSRGSFRWIDLFGTQALARWPMLAAAAYLSIPWVNAEIRQLTEDLLSKMPTDPSKVMASSAYLLDAMWLTLISLPTLILVIWMIWLMYHAFALSTDLKGPRAAFSFAGALIVAIIIVEATIFLISPDLLLAAPA